MHRKAFELGLCLVLLAVGSAVGCGGGSEDGASLLVVDYGTVADVQSPLGDESSAPPPDLPTDPPPDPGTPTDPGSCQPSCFGKACGPNGCGGLCGECTRQEQCEDGHCVPICLPQCAGAQCGEDGCGGSCGECQAATICKAGQCVMAGCKDLVDCALGCPGPLSQCALECVGPSSWVPPAFFEVIECLEGTCGPKPSPECFTAAASGECFQPFAACLSCEPQCGGKQCGSDGCGGVCGSCPAGSVCNGTKCDPVGVPECGELYLCVTECYALSGDAPGCLEGCGVGASSDAISKLLNLGLCATQCGDDLEVNSCVVESCFGEVHACLVGSSGPLDCIDLNLCVKACPYETEGCALECYQQGEYGAVFSYLLYRECLEDVCGPDPSGWCVEVESQETCSKTYQQCFGG